ncbi:hypothetical protein [Actinokineospora inagensis]|uniref:hypothetical protein n=1 Tax=Actinokineospora inagensis TaxID=103730 RepID=UPI0004283000|nr:hypothetical protein [Actinokineospora inagensis]
MRLTKRTLALLGVSVTLASLAWTGTASADDNPTPPPPDHPHPPSLLCAVGFDPHLPKMVMGSCVGEGAFVLQAFCADPGPHISSPIRFHGQADTFVAACAHGPTWAKVFEFDEHGGPQKELAAANV